jgi:hypothetical protein
MQALVVSLQMNIKTCDKARALCAHNVNQLLLYLDTMFSEGYFAAL